MCKYSNYAYNFAGNPNGKNNLYEERNDGTHDVKVATYRTPRWSNSKKIFCHIFFSYGDGKTITSWYSNDWQAPYEVTRPACAIEQDIEQFGGATQVVGYQEGDVVYQTVASQKLKFVCIDPNYVDASGKDIGALFLSTEIIGANKSIFDKESNVWATSDLRAYLNGSNSITDGLVLANTTVNSQGLNGCMNWHGMYFNDYGITSLSPTIETYDYFFALSVEEMHKYQKFMLSSNGQIRDMNKNWGEDKYGFYLRTPATNTIDKAYYVYSDAKYYNMLNAFTVYDGIIGSRPACVLPN